MKKLLVLIFLVSTNILGTVDVGNCGNLVCLCRQEQGQWHYKTVHGKVNLGNTCREICGESPGSSPHDGWYGEHTNNSHADNGKGYKITPAGTFECLGIDI